MDQHLTMLRLQLAMEYQQAGKVTPKVLRLSQILDKLVLDITIYRNQNISYNDGQALVATTG